MKDACKPIDESSRRRQCDVDDYADRARASSRDTRGSCVMAKVKGEVLKDSKKAEDVEDGCEGKHKRLREQRQYQVRQRPQRKERKFGEPLRRGEGQLRTHPTARLAI